MAIGKQIRAYRAQLGWTLRDLSKASGVPIGTISAVELRDSKKTEFAAPIASAFGLTLEQLVDDSRAYRCSPGKKPKDSLGAWPFCRISREDWQSLSAMEKDAIEVCALAFLRRK